MRSTPSVLILVVLVGCAARSAEPEQRVHEAVAAGSFYPRDAKELRDTVHRLVTTAPRVAQHPVRAVLAPHAGYVYAAPVAAASFRQLEPGFQRVVIIAGNHSAEARFEGASVDTATAYRVPGLEVKVAPAARKLARQRFFVDAPAAHRLYVVEVELPFLAEVNQAPFELVPIIVGHLTPATAHELAKLLQPLADAKTRFVFSVDLSHFYPYDDAVAKDRACLSALEAVDLEQVAGCDTDATQVLTVMTEPRRAAGLDPTPGRCGQLRRRPRGRSGSGGGLRRAGLRGLAAPDGRGRQRAGRPGAPLGRDPGAARRVAGGAC